MISWDVATRDLAAPLLLLAQMVLIYIGLVAGFWLVSFLLFTVADWRARRRERAQDAQDRDGIAQLRPRRKTLPQPSATNATNTTSSNSNERPTSWDEMRERLRGGR